MVRPRVDQVGEGAGAPPEGGGGRSTSLPRRLGPVGVLEEERSGDDAGEAQRKQPGGGLGELALTGHSRHVRSQRDRRRADAGDAGTETG